MGAIERCAAAYRNAAGWRGLQQNGMARDFSWNRAAREYGALYERIVSAREIRPR